MGKAARRRAVRVAGVTCLLCAGAGAIWAGLRIPPASAAGPAVRISVAPPAFSPNGDGLKEAVRIHVHVDEPSNLTVNVIGEQGHRVSPLAPRTSVPAGTTSYRWTGRPGTRTTGKPAPDGFYTIRAKAVAEGGGSTVASVRVLLDTTPPLVRPPKLDPVKIARGTLVVTTDVSDLMETVRLHVLLFAQDGKHLWTGKKVVEPTGTVQLGWRGAAGRIPGAYGIAVSASDGLGNVSLSTVKPFVVRHKVHTHVWGRFGHAGRHIALTFDDCNSSSAWASILRTLHRSHLKATFFCPGRQVVAFPELARRTIAQGHAVGSHGWDHAFFPGLSYGEQLGRLIWDRDIWWKTARTAATPYFRPPYGAYNRTTLAAAGQAGYFATVLWDVDPQDWRQPGSAAIIQRVVSHTHAGSIVLMHVLPQTAAALPTIVSRLRARHYRPVTLPVLARIGKPSSGGWPRNGSSGGGGG